MSTWSDKVWTCVSRVHLRGVSSRHSHDSYRETCACLLMSVVIFVQAVIRCLLYFVHLFYIQFDFAHVPLNILTVQFG